MRPFLLFGVNTHNFGVKNALCVGFYTKRQKLDFRAFAL